MSDMSTTPNSGRRNLYKRGSPSTWKETYRKRCFERLRGSRESLLQKFRGCPTSPATPRACSRIGNISSPGSFVPQLMEEEWKLLREEDPTFGMIEGEIDLMEALQEDLMKEEQNILAEYEASLRLEEAQFQAAVSHFHSDAVMCPVCKRNELLLNQGIVFCVCGLRIDTEQDCLSLKNIQETLEIGVAEHSASCTSEPGFAITDLGGTHNLVMSCKECGFLHIVI
ncbi:RPA-interacting protein B-like [Diadema setosum]|uniref:RPA-interacting protein B-like n=1 Tax=Diadema setosum TaxID=31175 RepID=UPI003B3A984D